MAVVELERVELPEPPVSDEPDPDPDDDVAKVLLHAAWLIERYGWIQFRGGDKTVGMCVGQAMSYGLDRYGKALLGPEVSARFQKVTGDDRSISFWNDYCCESKEQAIATLREAAWR